MYLDDFIHDLRHARRDHNLLAIHELVREAIDGPPLAAEVGDPLTSQVLHAESGLLVLHVVVRPEYCTASHDHGGWSIVGIQKGQEDNVFYQRVPRSHQIEQTGGRDLAEGDVLILDETAIHSIANPRATFLLALHVYGRNIFAVERSAWDPTGQEEERFDFDKHAGGPLVS